MKYDVVLTRTAEGDLDDIVEYIARVLHNPAAAQSLLNHIEQEIENLSRYPEAHPLGADIHLRERGLRVFVTNNYLGVYRVRADDHTVVILRFLHGRRDWQSLLLSDAPQRAWLRDELLGSDFMACIVSTVRDTASEAHLSFRLTPIPVEQQRRVYNRWERGIARDAR